VSLRLGDGPRGYRESVLGLAEEYTVPLYSQAEAARIIDEPTNTVRNWAQGYAYRTTAGPQTAEGLITVAADRIGRRSLPFIGLAEAYVIASVKKAGVPMQRIRPAIEAIRREMGTAEALLSERLKTDGVELLFDYVEDDGADQRGLAVVRNKQGVFRDVVADYLQTISYSHGLVESFRPIRYAGSVFVDPRINSGRPSFVESGVRLVDVEGRIAAGEPLADIADDYDIDPDAIRRVLIADGLAA
jgi:uncharacterized protein (DUF433 family)